MSRKGTRNARIKTSDFYCPSCGKYSMSLPRPWGQRERLHRKWLYCPKCGKRTNQVECRLYGDVQEFQKLRENGFYEEETDEIHRMPKDSNND